MPRKRFCADPIGTLRWVAQLIALADEVIALFDDGKLTAEEQRRIGELFADLTVLHRIGAP